MPASLLQIADKEKAKGLRLNNPMASEKL